MLSSRVLEGCLEGSEWVMLERQNNSSSSSWVLAEETWSKALLSAPPYAPPRAAPQTTERRRARCSLLYRSKRFPHKLGTLRCTTVCGKANSILYGKTNVFPIPLSTLFFVAQLFGC